MKAEGLQQDNAFLGYVGHFPILPFIAYEIAVGISQVLVQHQQDDFLCDHGLGLSGLKKRLVYALVRLKAWSIFRITWSFLLTFSMASWQVV